VDDIPELLGLTAELAIAGGEIDCPQCSAGLLHAGEEEDVGQCLPISPP
jgi:hypothetical protein